MKNLTSRLRYKSALDQIRSRPHPVPALLVQRFGALLLDIGLLIGCLIVLNLIWHWASGTPIETYRPRYRPPDPDMGWSRTLRSAGITTGLIALAAVFIASPLRATPGMLAFHLQVSDKNGQKIGFTRSFLWNLLSFLPLLLANYCILIGIALERPLIHAPLPGAFSLNLFSVFLILQNLWFFSVLHRPDKASLPDLMLGVRVDHRTETNEGLPWLQRLFYTPFLALFSALMLGTTLVAGLNLVDMPLHPDIRALQEQKPEGFNVLRESWKSESATDISLELVSFRCASKHLRFRRNILCPELYDLPGMIATHQDVLDAYFADVQEHDAASNPALFERYLKRESVALTDLALASLILSAETKPETARESFDKWLNLERFWRQTVTQPGLLVTQSRALIHYAHVLHTLPILGASAPERLQAHADDILENLTPVSFDEAFVKNLMAYEYELYDRILRHSQIDYFPFIQPNHTRNLFGAAMQAYVYFFDESVFRDILPKRAEQLNHLRDQHAWTKIYNPLGSQFRDLALESLQSNLHVISAYHNNNGLKKMLRIYVMARKNAVTPQDTGDFIKTLPFQERSVFNSMPIDWSERDNALYYSLPNAPGLSHYLVF